MLSHQRQNDDEELRAEEGSTENDVLLDYPAEAERQVTIFVQQLNTDPHTPLRIRLSQKLFGPPRISLSWKERCNLFHQLGKLDNLISLTLHGTTMGQVVSAELIALAIPPQLQVLRVEAGLIIDKVSSVCSLARAIHRHQSLRELYLMNFLNHVQPIYENEFALLDPVVRAAASVANLGVFELSSLASFMEWQTPLVSSKALASLLQRRKHLYRLELTNLGLKDAQFSIIAKQKNHRLREVFLNANENTINGMREIIYAFLCLGSKVSHLQVMNHVKLTEELFTYVVCYLERYYCPLREFYVTYPLRMDISPIQMYLRLHKLNLHRAYYSPNSATLSSCARVLAEVSDSPDCLYKLLKEKPQLMDRSKTERVIQVPATSKGVFEFLTGKPKVKFYSSFRHSCVTLAVIMIGIATLHYYNLFASQKQNFCIPPWQEHVPAPQNRSSDELFCLVDVTVVWRPVN